MFEVSRHGKLLIREKGVNSKDGRTKVKIEKEVYNKDLPLVASTGMRT